MEEFQSTIDWNYVYFSPEAEWVRDGVYEGQPGYKVTAGRPPRPANQAQAEEFALPPQAKSQGSKIRVAFLDMGLESQAVKAGAAYSGVASYVSNAESTIKTSLAKEVSYFAGHGMFTAGVCLRRRGRPTRSTRPAPDADAWPRRQRRQCRHRRGP